MQIFTDDNGQSWTLAVTSGAIRRVKALIPDVDLIDMGPDQAARLAVDPLAICDVVYALVKPQADQLGISDVDFGERMGLALGSAIKAFWQDLKDFFQSLDRQDQARLMEIPQEIVREVIEHNAAAIETYKTELRTAATRPPANPDPAIGKSSTDLPALSASTLTLSP